MSELDQLAAAAQTRGNGGTVHRQAPENPLAVGFFRALGAAPVLFVVGLALYFVCGAIARQQAKAELAPVMERLEQMRTALAPPPPTAAPRKAR